MYSNQTPNYDLPQYVGTDYPSWLTDFNESMSKIDTALHANRVQGDGNSDSITSLQQSVETLNENYNGIDSKVDELNEAVDQATKTANTAKIAADSAANDVAGFNNRIVTLETASAEYGPKIDTLQEQSADYSTRITNLENAEQPVYKPPIQFTLPNLPLVDVILGETPTEGEPYYQIQSGNIQVKGTGKVIKGSGTISILANLAVGGADGNYHIIPANTLKNIFGENISDTIKVNRNYAGVARYVLISGIKVLTRTSNYSLPVTGNIDQLSFEVDAMRNARTASDDTLFIDINFAFDGISSNSDVVMTSYNYDNQTDVSVINMFKEIAAAIVHGSVYELNEAMIVRA